MARQRVLGLPIGKQKRSSHQMAKTAGAAAAVLAPALAVPVARRAAPALRNVGKVALGAGHLIGKGESMAGKASEVMETASNVKDAVSSHSSTIGKVVGGISALAKGGKSGGSSKPKLSHLIEQHTDIAVPRSVAYNQWTQLEMFPTLTKGVESVDQEEDDKAKWTAKIGPSRRTWTGKIVEQIPDERIAWKSEGGASLQGVVTFHSLDVDLTRVLLQMEYKPTGPVEWVGNTLRIQRRRAKRDLRLFKHFIELRGEETGAWRGRIDNGKLEPKFAGQGKVEGAGKSQGRRQDSSAGSNRRNSDSNGSRRSPNRSSSPSNGSPKDRNSSQASSNGRRNNGRAASSRSPARHSASAQRRSSGGGSPRRQSTARARSSA